MILGDDVVRLRPLSLDDVDEWMAGEDEEQIRVFEFPGPAPRANVVAAIEGWMTRGARADPCANGACAT